MKYPIPTPFEEPQRGFAIMTAIFLLVVLSALGAFLVSISTTQQAGQVLDMQGARAYQAARAGIEWGLFQVMNPENANLPAPGPYTTQYACSTDPSKPTVSNLPALGGSLAGFAISVACVASDHSDAGYLKRIYILTSTASAGAASSPDFVERQLSVTVSTCRQALNGPLCWERS